MSDFPNPVGRVAEPIARAVSILVGWAILAFSVALTVEIVARKLFGLSFKGMDELGGFVLAITAAVGASYAMAMRGHTRVDVFLVRLPRPLQRVLNTLALISLAGFAGFAAWRGWAVIDETLEFSSSAPNLGIPLWVPQSAWLTGLVLFAAIAAAYALHALFLLVTGRPGIDALYGPLSVEEELHGELEALEARHQEERR